MTPVLSLFCCLLFFIVFLQELSAPSRLVYLLLTKIPVHFAAFVTCLDNFEVLYSRKPNAIELKYELSYNPGEIFSSGKGMIIPTRKR